jgi:hypothetical protein
VGNFIGLADRLHLVAVKVYSGREMDSLTSLTHSIYMAGKYISYADESQAIWFHHC